MSKSAKILNHLCLDFSSIKAIKQLANLDTLTKFEFLSNLTRGVADQIEKRKWDVTRTGSEPIWFREKSGEDLKKYTKKNSKIFDWLWIRVSKNIFGFGKISKKFWN